jgi:hypothetical protein
MTSTKKQSILIVVVVIVWGVIGYQIYQVIDGSAAVIIPKAKISTPIDTLSAEPYQLIANYRDPFLKNKSGLQKKSTGSRNIKSVKINTTVASAPVNWNAFKFLGTVENEDTKDRVALINFQGKMMMLKKNDAVEGFNIIKVYKDSVQIGFKTQKKTLSKKSN